MFGNCSRKSFYSSRPALITALLAGTLFAVAASVFAVTTIGGNISTGGTLTVTGSTSIATTTPWGFFSLNPSTVT